MTARDRGSGRIEQAAVEGLGGEHRVGGDRGSVELRVVGEHLLGVGGGTLIARVGEVGQEVVECCSNRPYEPDGTSVKTVVKFELLADLDSEPNETTVRFDALPVLRV